MNPPEYEVSGIGCTEVCRGGFILLYIQYHKLTFIHELIFFTLEGLYRITLNRTEINFEWYHAALSQGRTIQVENHTWMFCKGRSHAQQW